MSFASTKWSTLTSGLELWALSAIKHSFNNTVVDQIWALVIHEITKAHSGNLISAESLRFRSKLWLIKKCFVYWLAPPGVSNGDIHGSNPPTPNYWLSKRRMYLMRPLSQNMWDPHMWARYHKTISQDNFLLSRVHLSWTFGCMWILVDYIWLCWYLAVTDFPKSVK